MNCKEKNTVKFFNLLTICMKAGKLLRGFDISKEAVMSGEASCIMTAADISSKTLKEIKFITEKKKDVKIISLPFDMATIEFNIGKKVGVMAVCDKGFSEKFFGYTEEIRKSEN